MSPQSFLTSNFDYSDFLYASWSSLAQAVVGTMLWKTYVDNSGHIAQT